MISPKLEKLNDFIPTEMLAFPSQSSRNKNDGALTIAIS